MPAPDTGPQDRVLTVMLGPRAVSGREVKACSSPGGSVSWPALSLLTPLRPLSIELLHSVLPGAC